MILNQIDQISGAIRHYQGPIVPMLLSLLLFVLLITPVASVAGNATTGKELYNHYCLGCHGDEKSSAAVGPSLKGVFGRAAGTEKRGVHSQALLDAKITWNEKTLRKFLIAPLKELPGTYMPAGVPDAAQIDHIIAYLRSYR